ncbi:MAG: hypothetical protein ACI8WT_000833 [Clostridium sp.]|jgi:hypothetical protein
MKNIKKLTSILMVASMTMVLFSGCSSKKIDTSTDTSSTTTDTTSVTQDTKKNDPTAMKTTYTTVLKALVTDSTITQAQSDKVLEVVAKEPTDGTTPTEGQQKQHKNNKLSELVTSEVITQAQADTINQKVKEAMDIAQDTTTN